MNLNIDLNSKEVQTTLNEILAKCEEVEKHAKKLQFLTIKDVADMIHCSIKTSQDIFNLPDFPSIDFTKSKIVLIDAFKKWCMTKRSKKDYE